ncbi:hypothetical protein K435DRAFT_367598 [Dendrothele bispora CBS 962.96]|uniref:Uncharacterized protein n=1 Tax=Dendrothele bispora (strain CBS 962.96) TaxID=1314807 RepID=A0A4V4HD89_DENBC|nr:hypothetical protein K435DRAFT_367598 [Dendrothele bispora CBS 962.96]
MLSSVKTPRRRRRPTSSVRHLDKVLQTDLTGSRHDGYRSRAGSLWGGFEDALFPLPLGFLDSKPLRTFSKSDLGIQLRTAPLYFLRSSWDSPTTTTSHPSSPLFGLWNSSQTFPLPITHRPPLSAQEFRSSHLVSFLDNVAIERTYVLYHRWTFLRTSYDSRSISPNQCSPGDRCRRQPEHDWGAVEVRSICSGIS